MERNRMTLSEQMNKMFSDVKDAKKLAEEVSTNVLLNDPDMETTEKFIKMLTILNNMKIPEIVGMFEETDLGAKA